MGVTVRVRRTRSDAERWSFAAFVLAVVGLSLAASVVFASDSDPWHVRWWLVALPLVFTATPVVLARRSARVAAMVLLGGWCVVASASIGLFLVPALVVSVVALRSDD